MDPQFEDPHTLLPVGTHYINIAPYSTHTHTHTHTHTILKWSYALELWAMSSWTITGYNYILKLRAHPVPTSAPYISDNTISTEEIWTKDPQFECPCTLPSEVIGKFPLATTSRSTFHQHHSILSPPPSSSKTTSQRCGSDQDIFLSNEHTQSLHQLHMYQITQSPLRRFEQRTLSLSVHATASRSKMLCWH